MKEWKDQNMKERAAFIRKCVSLGITDNDEIKNFFKEYQLYLQDNEKVNSYADGRKLQLVDSSTLRTAFLGKPLLLRILDYTLDYILLHPYAETSNGNIANFVLPEVTISGDMPDRYKLNKEFLKLKGESEEHYRARITELNKQRLEVKLAVAEGMNTVGLNLGRAATIGLGITTGANLLPVYQSSAIRPVVDTMLDIDGLRNLASDNGVSKTIREAKLGNYGRALLSGVGDTLDALGIGNTLRTGINIAKPSYRAYHAYHTINPVGYNYPVLRGMKWIDSMLLNKDYGNAVHHMSNDELTNLLPYLEHSNLTDELAKYLILIGRDEAFRKYLNQPSKIPIYKDNGDGTFSYNLDEINKALKKLFPDDFKEFRPGFEDTLKVGVQVKDTYELVTRKGHDFITSAGGGLTRNDNILLDRFYQPLLNNKLLDDIGVKIIEDLYDLQPFERKSKDLPKWLGKSVRQKIKNFEAGKLLGGKPFTMHTELPYSTIATLDDDGDFVLYVTRELGFPEKFDRVLSPQARDYISTGILPNSSIYSPDKTFNYIPGIFTDISKDREKLSNIEASTKYPVGGNLKNRIKRKLDNAVYNILDFFLMPKDYSDETAILRNGKPTTECALWSNDQLRGQGIPVYGDAWTRTANAGIKKVYSGYNPANRPETFNESDYNDYVYSAADSIKNVLDPSLLLENDIVGLYYRRSPNKLKAFLNGANGEVQTHTGHIIILDGKPYVIHNIHEDITLNRVEDVLGGNKPFGIVSVYRMPLAKKKKKSNGGELRTVRVKNILLDD